MGAAAEEHTVRYAADVTVKDVWAVDEFLSQRLDTATRAHAPDTEEHRTASALAESVARLVLELEWSITGAMPGRVRPPTDAPTPAPLTAEQIREQAKARLRRTFDDWNHLCAIAGHWQTDPAYNGARWHEVEFLDAEAEHIYDQQVASLRAQGILRPLPPADSHGGSGPEDRRGAR